jgi:hypothetical protein
MVFDTDELGLTNKSILLRVSVFMLLCNIKVIVLQEPIILLKHSSQVVC